MKPPKGAFGGRALPGLADAFGGGTFSVAAAMGSGTNGPKLTRMAAQEEPKGASILAAKVPDPAFISRKETDATAAQKAPLPSQRPAVIPVDASVTALAPVAAHSVAVVPVLLSATIRREEPKIVQPFEPVEVTPALAAVVPRRKMDRKLVYCVSLGNPADLKGTVSL